MRLRQRDQRTVNFHPPVSERQADGTTFTRWSDVGIPVQGKLQPAGGKAMAEMYGDRLAYMLTFFVGAGEPVEEGAGACVYKLEPDFKVVAIRRWSEHWVVDLEAIR